MKKFLFLLTSVALFAVGCHTDNYPDHTINTENTFVEISLSQTKTSLGDKINNKYPTYWSEDDKIVINGVCSEDVEIDGEDRSRATFTLQTTLDYPYNITYPFSSATTSHKAIVEFPAEQTYTEGSFGKNCAPMCGYVENKGDRIHLSHLASILRFPVKAKYNNTILKRVVITSTTGAIIAGTFEVNCKNSTITPTENSGNSIIYSLPINFTLKTDKESIFYISLPAVDVGSCTIEFEDASGDKMVANWAPSAPLSKGVVREFDTTTYVPNETVALPEMEIEYDSITIFYKKNHGNVRYSDGTPIADVAVSDGFQVVKTDKNGYYELNDITNDTWYIYCSLPADVKVPINEHGIPCFYKEYPSSSRRYDFTFEKLAGGAEKEFALFAIADPQVGSADNIARFKAQASTEIKAYSQQIGIPSYGVALGDIIYNSGTRAYLFDGIREALSITNTGIPVFAVMGNHDNADFSTTRPIFANDRSSTFNLAIQRPFEVCFGPVNYSFNRGDVHIVCMRNMQWKDNTHPGGDYITTCFTDQQYEWLKQDLAAVPKDKMVVLCVHIPIFNKSSSHIQDALNLLDQFNEAYVLSGHLHFRECYDHVAKGTGHKIIEHSISSAHGAGWGDGANICCDGAPNGYEVFIAKDNSCHKYFYKGYPDGMNSPDYQIRLHRGGDITGAEISGDNTNGTKGYYQFPYDNSVILANVFSSDPWSWTVEVWNYNEATGKRTTKIGDMVSLEKYHKTPIFEDLIGSFTYTDPKRAASDIESGRDYWTTGVLLGHLGKKATYHFHECHTMWKYKLNNPDTKVMVVARDRFGNEYTQTEFQVGTDVGYARYNP